MAEQSPTNQRWRFDEPHREPPNPHMFELPRKSEIRLLLLQLDDEEMELRRFSRRLSLFPGLNRYVIAMANYRLADRDRRINDSAHASALLGINELHKTLRPLLELDRNASKAG